MVWCQQQHAPSGAAWCGCKSYYLDFILRLENPQPRSNALLRMILNPVSTKPAAALRKTESLKAPGYFMTFKKKASRPTKAKASHPKTEQDVREAKIELARISFLDFIEYVIKDKSGKPVTVAPQQRVWNAHLDYCWKHSKAAAILAPMGHGKTVSIAIALVLWLLGQNESFRVILVSSSAANAAKRLQELQRYIENSSEYKDVFPWIEPDKTRPWTQETLNVVRSTAAGGSINPSVGAYGYTSTSSIGDRADVIIFDDVVFDENAFSAVERAKLFRSVTTTWLTRTSGESICDRWGNEISNDTLIVAIGTRYHVEDLYAELMMAQQYAWCTLVHRINQDKTAMEATVYGRVADSPHPIEDAYAEYHALENPIIHPIRLVERFEDVGEELPPIDTPITVDTPLWALRSRKWLIKEEARITSPAFARGYEQKPSSSQDLFFPHLLPGNVFYGEDWRRIDNPDHPGYISPMWTRSTGVDLAGKNRRGTVIFTSAMDPYGVRHLVDIRMGAWSQPETCDYIEDVYKTHFPSLIYVESNALQGAILDWIDKDTEKYTFGSIAEPFLTTGTKTHPELGLPGLDLQFAARRWRISIPHERDEIVEPNPKNPSKCGCAYCTLVSDLSGFTWDDLDKTPDSIMAMFFADRAAQAFGDVTAGAISIQHVNAKQIARSSNTIEFDKISMQLRLPIQQIVYRDGAFGSTTNRYKEDMGRGVLSAPRTGKAVQEWKLYWVELVGEGDERHFYVPETNEVFYESNLPPGAIWRNFAMEKMFDGVVGHDKQYLECKMPYGIVALDGKKKLRSGSFPDITYGDQIVMGNHRLIVTDGVLKEIN